MGTHHLSSWPPGVPRELTLPDTSLWANLAASATRAPDQAALVFYGGSLPYRELARACERMAGFLARACGVARGDRVALFMHNSPQFVIAYYAILRADAVVVPVDPMNVTVEIEHVLLDSEARVMFASQELVPNAVPLLGRGEEKPLRHLIVSTDSDYLTTEIASTVPDFVKARRTSFDAPRVTAWADAIACDLAPGPHRATPDNLCVLPYTSGAGGRPKACMHTHRSVMHATVAGPVWNGVVGDECELATLPFFHATGMRSGMNAPIYAGSTIVLLPRWDPVVAAKLIRRYRVTGWTVMPTMLVDFLSSPGLDPVDLASLRVLSLVAGMNRTGVALPEAIAQKLKGRGGLTYMQQYGASETAGLTHLNPPHKPKKQCLGIPIFGTDARVVDPQTLDELAPGEAGEIVVSGPQVFAGYRKNPHATDECFVEIDGKRFFRTGDVGRVDEDGYFFLIDRFKEVIDLGLHRVWPAEVEAMLYGHPAILDAVVVRARGAQGGEIVKAVVVLRDDAKRDAKLDEHALIEWCKPQMADYKVPRSVVFVESLPKTAVGMINRRALQRQEDEHASPGRSAGEASSQR